VKEKHLHIRKKTNTRVKNEKACFEVAAARAESRGGGTERLAQTQITVPGVCTPASQRDCRSLPPRRKEQGQVITGQRRPTKRARRSIRRSQLQGFLIQGGCVAEARKPRQQRRDHNQTHAGCEWMLHATPHVTPPTGRCSSRYFWVCSNLFTDNIIRKHSSTV
jgi:hypothetical protein